MSPAEDPMVRRLSPGGNRIRTIGSSAGDIHPSSPYLKRPRLIATDRSSRRAAVRCAATHRPDQAASHQVVRAVIGAKHGSARTGSKAQAAAVENRSGREINCCCLRHRF